MMKVHKILSHLVPNSEYVVRGQVTTEQQYLDQVEWLDERPQPTWAEIEAARPTVETATANKLAEQARAHEYRTEADPLFFGFQRGENSEQEWLDKVAEIRARHPYA